MTIYMTSPQLKKSARARLAPVSSTVLGATAIYYGIILALSMLTLLIDTSSFENSPLALVPEFMIAALTNILGVGYQYLFLKLYCGRRVSANDIFYAFKNQRGISILLSFTMAAISTFSMMPFYIFLNRFSVSQNSTDAAIAFFCLTPAMVLITIVNLLYAQIYYLMLDFPDYTLKELFRYSRLLMREHKGRLFYIRVSFLPWILLGLFTCGIGMLWATPYLWAVQTEFYLDLVSRKQRKQ